jgi:hypothetical protein
MSSENFFHQGNHVPPMWKSGGKSALAGDAGRTGPDSGQNMCWPPLMAMLAPVRKAASSEAR